MACGIFIINELSKSHTFTCNLWLYQVRRNLYSPCILQKPKSKHSSFVIIQVGNNINLLEWDIWVNIFLRLKYSIFITCVDGGWSIDVVKQLTCWVKHSQCVLIVSQERGEIINGFSFSTLYLLIGFFFLSMQSFLNQKKIHSKMRWVVTNILYLEFNDEEITLCFG